MPLLVNDLFALFWHTSIVQILLLHFSDGRNCPPSLDTDFDPLYGVILGGLDVPESIGIAGNVSVVNGSCIQVLNFTFYNNTDSEHELFFWLDRGSELTSTGVKVSTFEFGTNPIRYYENARVVLSFPDLKINDYRSFGLYCQSSNKNFGTLRIPETLDPPKAQFLDGNIVATEYGERYNVMSGPVLVMDRRTIKIYGFHFNGARAPDGYFFVGQGTRPNRRDDGVKVAIRGKDRPDHITAISEKYTGNRDLILHLPASYDICSINWISVYCYRFGVDFGHIRISNVSGKIPPFVPLQKKKPDGVKSWKPIKLLGTEARRNFTFQVGPPGGKRGYHGIIGLASNDFAWYVNGYMIPELWLVRGRTYNFIIEGGNDKESDHFYNPFYICDDPFGGYQKLSEREQQQVDVFVGLKDGMPTANSIGRLCLWSPIDPEENPDTFEDIQSYRKSLQLKCKPGKSGLIQWTPDKDTPQDLFYQSYSAYRMGGKIVVKDKLPSDMPDFQEEPYRTDIWIDTNLLTEVPQHRPQQNFQDPTQASFSPKASIFVISVLVVLSTFFIFLSE